MEAEPRLDAYHFYKREWDSYDQLVDSFEWEVPDRFNMATYVCDRWAEDEDRVALFAENQAGETQSYTYRDLRDVTNRLANALAHRGLERGDRIGINTPQSHETAIAHIAAWKLGAVTVPLSTLFGTDGLRYRLADAGAKACIVDASNVATLRSVRGKLDDLEDILTVNVEDSNADEQDLWTAMEGQSPRREVVDTAAEDDAIIIYTSGTTGDPKGVRHAQRVLLGNLPMVITTFCNMELGNDDVFWTPSEWAWVATLFDILFPGLFYGRPVVAYQGGSFDPETAFRIIEDYGVTVFFAPPTALRMMMQVTTPEERYDVESVRVVPSGGEAVGASIVDWAAETFDGAVVQEAYGQTEANMIVGDCTNLLEYREGKLGKAAPGHEIAIVDPDTAEANVPPEEVGEIAVRYDRDPVCFVEYWNKPEQTRVKVRNGWLLTGDLGWRDEDGYFVFTSRKDTVIISAGYRIGPVEIEEALATHEAVADAGVIGIPDEERGEVPKAFVVLARGFEPSKSLVKTLQDHVRERLAQYEYPREIEFIDDLPKTVTGKIRRIDLERREGLAE